MDRELCGKIGAKIRAFRKNTGLTISQLAELADVDSGFLNYIETGKKAPSLATVAKIAKGLKIPISDLFRDVDHSEKCGTLDDKIFHQFRSLFNQKSAAQKEDLLIILKQLRNPDKAEALRKLIRK